MVLLIIVRKWVVVSAPPRKWLISAVIADILIFVTLQTNPCGPASLEGASAAATPIAALGCAALMASAGSGRWGKRIPARLRERAFDVGGFGYALYSVLVWQIQGRR